MADRDKLDELYDVFDGRPEGSTRGNMAFLGRVTGSPSGIDGRFVLVNPVSVGGTEAEGEPATLTPDTTREIPVVVTGQIPAVGDDLICLDVANRWVAIKLGASDPCYYKCGTSSLPLGDVKLAVDGGDPIDLLLYADESGVISWVQFPDFAFVLECVEGDLVLTVQDADGSVVGPTGVVAHPFAATFNDDSHEYVLSGPEWWPEPGDPNCVFCGDPCGEICEGHSLAKSGWITDSNGTTPLLMGPFEDISGGAGVFKITNSALKQTFSPGDVLTSVPALDAEGNEQDPCLYLIDTVWYAHRFYCDGSGFDGAIKVELLASAGVGPFGGGTGCGEVEIPTGNYWITNSPDTSEDTYLVLGVGTVTDIECDGKFMTGTVTWPAFGGSPSVIPPLPDPPLTATVRIPLFAVRPEFCCDPLAIPRRDLKLTVVGVGEFTLVYHQEGPGWYDETETYLLECVVVPGVSRSMSFGSVGTAWAVNEAASWAVPYHLQFDGFPSGTAYVDEIPE